MDKQEFVEDNIGDDSSDDDLQNKLVAAVKPVKLLSVRNLIV